MLPRVIPSLLLRGDGLVKTVGFTEPRYVGDPINAVRIFDTKEVDELALLDISATPEGRGPDFELIARIASEAFMPVSYGGGVTSVEDVRRLIGTGVEKVVIGTGAHAQPTLISEAARVSGSQSIVAAIDVKPVRGVGYRVFSHSGTRDEHNDAVTYARQVEDAGAGEILLNSIDRDGTREGYDLELVAAVADAVGTPVVAVGGASSIADLVSAIGAGASAVSAGSLFVFHGKHRAVLITYPERSELEAAFAAPVSAGDG